MDRNRLFEIAKKRGWLPGKVLNADMRAGIKKDLLDYFRSPGGKAALKQAPPWMQEKGLDEIVDLLLQEVS